MASVALAAGLGAASVLATPAAGTPSAGTATGAATARTAPEFTATVSRLTRAERAAMKPDVWRRGCPVSLRSLRAVRVTRWTFRGTVATGTLVVHRSVADDAVVVMASLFDIGFPIRRMRPIEAYRGSDFASIEADNTSAFNCRFVDGTRRWSQHAYGRSIDLNPLENPYVSRGRTSHTASVPYVRRRPARPGMIVKGGAALRAFESAGWEWGGRWRPDRDYQHFTAP